MKTCFAKQHASAWDFPANARSLSTKTSSNSRGLGCAASPVQYCCVTVLKTSLVKRGQWNRFQAKTMSRAPSSLLFTQDSISSTFSDGSSINDEINRIKSLWSWSRSSALADFEPLEIDQDRYDGKWYCNDNRRLYLFKVLEKQGYVSTVKVRKGHIRPKPPSAGCHVRVRGDTTLVHCSCNDSSCSVM